MVHSSATARQFGASLTRVDSEHPIPGEFLDEEDRERLEQVDLLILAREAITLREFGFELGDPGVAKKLVKRAFDLTHGLPPRPPYDEVYRAKARSLKDQSQVYYCDMGGDVLKIGYSVNLYQRCSALRVPTSAVLATEPGDLELERLRHKQFAHLRIGRRENFRKSDELTAHIALLLKHFGPPRITSYVRP